MLGGDNDDFDAWLEEQMHEETRIATPMFANLFGSSASDEKSGGISAVVREAIEEATNSAVDAARLAGLRRAVQRTPRRRRRTPHSPAFRRSLR